MRSSILLFMIIMTTFSSCTTYRYSHTQNHIYIPTNESNITTQKIFNAPFDKVWTGIVSFFAEQNISIATIEKDSGIVVAEKMFGNPEDTIGVILPGIVKTEYVKITQTMRPKEYFGCLNPDYIRLYGQVVDEQKTIIKTSEDVARYNIQMKFNVFAVKVTDSKTRVSVNLEFRPLENVYGYTPRPRSSGYFEEHFFKYVDNYLSAK